MTVKRPADIFEDKVFAYVQRYVASGDSFLNPRWCQFFRQKRYYSADRGSKITVDIAVECYSDGAEDWSLLLVAECKHYTHPVPVDDVEEFVAKLDQIAGKDVKGAIFSTASFQSGARAYAKSKGIALIRMLPEDQIEWILRRTPVPVKVGERGEYRENQIEQALSVQEYVGQAEFLFGCVDGFKATSLIDLLNELIGSGREADGGESGWAPPIGGPVQIDRRPDAPFVGQEEIESRTGRIIDFFQDTANQTTEVNLSPICAFIEEKYDVTFLFQQALGVDATGREILGKLLVDPMRVYISETLERDSHRWRFTVAHEIGHFVLHRRLDLRRILGAHLDTEITHSVEILDAEPNIYGRLEWQANTFASCLLMRRERVLETVVAHLRRDQVNNFSHGIVFLDEQQCNLQAFLRLVGRVSRECNVSKEAATYRLAQLNILNDQRKLTRVSDVLKSLFGEGGE